MQACGKVEVAVTSVRITIANKQAMRGAEIKLVTVVGTKMRPTSRSKIF